MLSKFLSGALISVAVIAVNYFTTSPQKKMSKTRRILLSLLICVITGVISMLLP